MSEHNRAIDEFESIFRRSHIPHPTITTMGFSKILVVIDQGEATEKIATLVGVLAHRFDAEFDVIAPVAVPEEAVDTVRKSADKALKVIIEALKEKDTVPNTQVVVGSIRASVLERIESVKPELIIPPAPFYNFPDEEKTHGPGSTIGEILDEISIPAILVKEQAKVSDDVLARILTVVPGPHDIDRELSVAFSLTESDGKLTLLHVVKQDALARIAEGLEISEDIDTESGHQTLIECVEDRMKAILRGIVEEAEEWSFAVNTSLETGQMEAVCHRHVRQEGATMAIVRGYHGDVRYLESDAH